MRVIENAFDLICALKKKEKKGGDANSQQRKQTKGERRRRRKKWQPQPLRLQKVPLIKVAD